MLDALNKRIVQLLAALILVGMSSMTNAAYPDRPLTLIVPFAAGGPTDVLARVVAESLTKVLGQPVIVENTPGAGGTVGGTRAARATGDGYTMLIGNGGTLAVNATLYKNLTYDVLKDFIPVASIGDAPQIISARKDFPATGLDEFAAYLKQNASKLNFGAAGVGSGTWLGGQLINVRLGVKVNGVNYRGAGQAVNDVMAGHIDYMVESTTTAVRYVKSGMVKGVVVLRPKRIAALPDVPSAGESGFPDLLYDIWNMILVPKGTPPEVVKKLNQSLLLALQAPELRTRFEAAGIEDPSPEQKTPEGARALLTSEVARWRPVIIDLGATPE
ncbi:MAG: tripartite tricarboxylate transporter substrate-binding protein [Alcaligenaceae bacterium]|jgi:tripartite-type tricarboxylate transporter receptor subunit TctC